MSRKCAISGKRCQIGRQYSHSHNKSAKTRFANLQTKRIFDSETGKWVKVRISTRMLRTIDKKGLSSTLRERGLTISDLI